MGDSAEGKIFVRTVDLRGIEGSGKDVTQNVRQILPCSAVFMLQDVCETAADSEQCGGVCRRIFHRLPLVRAHQTARNGAAVFRDNIGDAVFLGNLEGKYAGIVHTVGMDDVGNAVFPDIALKGL